MNQPQVNGTDLTEPARQFVHALIARGILIAPWDKEPNLAVFERGKVHGVADFRDPMMRVIAVMNDVKGNGQFAEIITAFEEVAVLSGRKFQIVQLWNKRLAQWFRRRGYKLKTNDPLGLHATYRHAPPT